MYVAGAENGISPGAPARRSGEVTVRFINTPAGEDVTTTAELGEVLMQVGDRAGVAVPRGCRRDCAARARATFRTRRGRRRRR